MVWVLDDPLPTINVVEWLFAANQPACLAVLHRVSWRWRFLIIIIIIINILPLCFDIIIRWRRGGGRVVAVVLLLVAEVSFVPQRNLITLSISVNGGGHRRTRTGQRWLEKWLQKDSALELCNRLIDPFANDSWVQNTTVDCCGHH